MLAARVFLFLYLGYLVIIGEFNGLTSRKMKTKPRLTARCFLSFKNYLKQQFCRLCFPEFDDA